ncbi:MAG: alpha/beta fold hydrolase [Desulfobulbaceae bacterium]|nr:alpha/beta fold hydrolase [Desulfobulbaceae bacterium]
MTESSDYLSEYPFTPSSYQLPDGKMSYIDVGKGPVVVMLHGNPSWSFYYRNLANLLKRSYRVIVPDHLGCGLSDKPQGYPYRLKDHIDNLQSLLDHLQIGRCSLVVHDWGGAIGMGYAVRNPVAIQSLVILNTAAFHSTSIPWRIKICRTPFLGPLLIQGLNAFAGAAVHMAVTRKMTKEIARGYLFPYNSWKNRIATLRFVQDIPLTEKDASWRTIDEIDKGLRLFTKTPMLISWGGKDFCFHDAFYKEWQKRFPQAECHYFKNAGHYVLEDAFDSIGPLVENFLAKNGAD